MLIRNSVRRYVLWACLAGIVAAGCSGAATLSEYAAQAEALVAEMNGTLDELEAVVESDPSLAATKRYATERVEARRAFVAGMSELEPPEEAADLHEAALAIMDRLAQAEAVLADRVAELTTNVGIDGIWNTPEGMAAREADAAAVALCQSAQSTFDETAVRAELGDVPWVPPEMKEVVIVTFGCLAADR